MLRTLRQLDGVYHRITYYGNGNGNWDAVAVKEVTRLLDAVGVVLLTLRLGPVPAGRRMFAVSAPGTIALAAKHGLT